MKKHTMNLQLLADNSPVRVYMKQYKELLQAVFKVQSHFSDFFVGGLEALDGVKNTDIAFSVKTSDIPVVVSTYSKDENTAFGTGTGSSSRFGKRTEVKYTDTDVPYSWEYTFHEGIDRTTVNNDFEDAIADRLDLTAQEKVRQFNTHHGSFISKVAANTFTMNGLTEAEVLKLFNNLSKHFVNVGAVGTKVAKVRPDLYNLLVDMALTTSSKGSTVKIDDNEIIRFKGFYISELPDDQFEENEYVLAYITHIAKAFTGIDTTRTIESEDFDGVALQGHGKAGEYIPEINKKAVVKAIVNTVQETPDAGA